MEAISFIWNEVFLRPMINSLVLLYVGLFSNLGLAIIVFTIIIRLVTLPLTLRQIRQTKAMMEIQPKMKELQQKYGKDRQRLSQETLRLYRQLGINPIGCLGPFVIQLPIWIGLFQALIRTLPSTPEAMVNLAQKFYFWLPVLHTAVPLNSRFLGMDLALPDPTRLVLPILVGVSTWVQQKMTTPQHGDPRQASTNTMLLWMMPVLLAFFSITFPSGLSLYWVVSNLIGVGIQGFLTGWEPLFARKEKVAAPAPTATPASVETNPTRETEDTKPQEAKTYGDEGGVRKDRGRGHRAGHKRARGKARGGGNRDTKPR